MSLGNSILFEAASGNMLIVRPYNYLRWSSLRRKGFIRKWRVQSQGGHILQENFSSKEEATQWALRQEKEAKQKGDDLVARWACPRR